LPPLICLLLLPFALAFVRHCRVPESRLRVIALLQSYETLTIAEVLSNRVLPFALVLLSDRDPVVRVAALRLCVSAFERGCVGASAYTTHLALDFALPRLLTLGQEENDELVLASLLAAAAVRGQVGQAVSRAAAQVSEREVGDCVRRRAAAADRVALRHADGGAGPRADVVGGEARAALATFSSWRSSSAAARRSTC
jgi:hypothetical protein